MYAAFRIGLGGDGDAFPVFHKDVHAVAPAQAEELALQIVVVLKTIVSAGGIQDPISHVDQVQKPAKLLFAQFNLHVTASLVRFCLAAG